MDLIRLGRNEIKRNWTRTGIALAATALAAWMLVVSHMIPRGYPWGVGQAERAFMGGDLVVLPLSGRAATGTGSELTLRPWEGRDWQSHALYYFHRLPQEGYISGPRYVWRSFSPNQVRDLIEDVSGITGIRPYVAIPCFVGANPAILRVRDARENESYPLSMERFVVEGQFPRSSPGASDEPSGPPMQALFPGSGELSYNLVGTSLPVRVPKVTVSPGATDLRLGLDWDNGDTVQLEVSGKYRVNANEVLEMGATEPSLDPVISEPRFWDRPEVIVTKETFQEILSMTGSATSLDELPTYELLVSVDRMSEAKTIALEIQAKLGDGFGVYPVPELKRVQATGSALGFESLQAAGLIQFQSFVLSGVIVAGSSYIMLVQQKRKIGLLRVIGATSKNVVVYVLTIVGYVAVAGAAIGFIAAKVLSIWSLFASEITAGEYLKQTALDFVSAFGMSLGVSLILGIAVGLWAARIPSAEVLKRE